jgi:hypothetical protein
MDSLPLDCIRLIAHKLTDRSDPFRGPAEMAKDAANLAQSCKAMGPLSDAVFARVSRDDAVRDRSRYVPVSTVSKHYLLKPADRMFVATRTIDRWGNKAFKLIDVRRACRAKFQDNADRWRAERRRLEADRAKRHERAERLKDQRRERLKAALAKRGCTLRNDSRLCKAFVERGEGDIEDVATVMEEMKFFHEHTDYREIYEEEREDELEYRGRFDPDEVSWAAQGIALREWARRFSSIEQACQRPELPRSLIDRLMHRRGGQQ